METCWDRWHHPMERQLWYKAFRVQQIDCGWKLWERNKADTKQLVASGLSANQAILLLWADVWNCLMRTLKYLHKTTTSTTLNEVLVWTCFNKSKSWAGSLIWTPEWHFQWSFVLGVWMWAAENQCRGSSTAQQRSNWAAAVSLDKKRVVKLPWSSQD